MIIDCHVHLLTEPQALPDTVQHMLGCMDRLGIDQVCLSLGNRLIIQPTAEELRESNEWVAKAVAMAPERIIGFVYCSPNHPELSLEQIEQYAVHGAFRGIKLWGLPALRPRRQ